MTMLPDEYSPDEMDRLHVLRSVEGYAELGMYDAAEEELQRLPHSQQEHSDVMGCRLQLCMRQALWSQAVEWGRRLCRVCPDLPQPFIHTAYCLHELDQTEEALRTLRLGPESLQEDAVFHYNTACYQAVLGRRKEARTALRTALALDESLRTHAEADPDLDSIRVDW